MKNEYLKLCLLTNASPYPFHEYQQILLNAIQGGVTSVQVREKNLSYSDLKNLSLKIQLILKPYSVPLIINDNVILAKEIDADGVHLGQEDMSPLEARTILGANKIIGISIESMQELEIANQMDCLDYIAASAVFPSKTKECKTIWGLQGLLQIAQNTNHPVIGIGGINLENVDQVIKHGAKGVAIISAIHEHVNTKEVTSQLIQKINYVEYENATK